MDIRSFTTTADRRNALEHKLGLKFSSTASHVLDGTDADRKHCENMIGATQIPLGIAGPIDVIHLQTAGEKQSYYLPLATTEGALVASVSRGCKAITQSGGALVDSHRVGATRGPVFRVTDLKESNRLYRYLNDALVELNEIAKKTSTHLKLVKILTRGAGRYRYARFVFDTSDAMGMNMVTIATQEIVAHIKAKTGIPCVAVAGNFDIDKKPSWLNAIENRGTKVWAEAVIPKKILKETLKTDSQSLYDVWVSKCMIGSALSGSLGFNAQFANITAAMFLATGQDPGHIAEASVGMTIMEQSGDDLYASVVLPGLMVGTVGGGTGLPTQREALSILGVAGGNNGANAQRFAEIVAAGVLAGELSLLSSLAEGSLGRAHKRLGRGESV